MSFRGSAKLAPLNSKYQQSSLARMGNRMAEYRKFIATPNKVNMMTTLQECLHDIYAKRPADPLLALSLRLQKKIASRASNRHMTANATTLNEVTRLSDENHRLRLLLGPEGMDMAESMERMQFTASTDRATITGLENSKTVLEREILSLKQQLEDVQAIITEKNSQLAQFAQSLNNLYGVDATEAVTKIQALQRGQIQRRRSQEETKQTFDEMSDSASDSGDDHQFDGEFSFDKMGESLSEVPRHHNGIKNRRQLVIQRRESKRAAAGSNFFEAEDDAENELNQDAINMLLSEDDQDITEQLDEKLQEILGDMDLDDAITAATKIQAIQRGHALRQQDSDEDLDEDVTVLTEYLSHLSDDDVEAAVLKIQALARGRIARSHAPGLEAPKFNHIGPTMSPDVEALEAFLEDQPDEEVDKCASKIQASFRGRKARKKVRRRRQEKAAVEIQRMARGKSARGQIKRRRLGAGKCATSLTSLTEEKVVGPDVQKLNTFLETQDAKDVEMAATKLQAIARGRKTRRQQSNGIF